MLPKILSPDLNSKFYKRNLKWTEDYVKENINIIENNYKKFPNRNRWQCDCHVIHDDEHYNDDVLPINFIFLREEYEKITLDFCNEKKLKLKHISDIWYNYYKIGQYQEPHIHDGNGYTVVHYMIFDPKYHFPTKFTESKIISPEIKRGDILFFPSDYEHYVPKNLTTMPRLTTAFTVVLQ